MEIERRSFFASLGGAAAVALMDSEARADALEHYSRTSWIRPSPASRERPKSTQRSPSLRLRSPLETIVGAPAAVRYHQALRFYPDAAAGYEYPDLYYRMFGSDYVPAAAHRSHLPNGSEAPLV